MSTPEDMHGIHSQPVSPQHQFAPVNAIKPANTPTAAAAEGLSHPQDRDYTLLVGGFIVVIAVFVGLLLSNYLSLTRYADNLPAPAAAPAQSN